MKEFLKRYAIEIIFTFLGAVSGYLYWKYVGCLSGTCAIKSVWYLSTLFGLLAGYVAGDLLKSFYLWITKKEQHDREI